MMLYKHIQDAFASDDREEPLRWQFHSSREVHALRMVTILTAIGVDCNKQVVPIAFAFVENENTES